MKELFWLVVFVAIGGAIVQQCSDSEDDMAEAAAIQQSIWRDLHQYKVDHAKNRKGMPSNLLERARKANTLHESDESQGLLALVSVWEHRWHYRKAEWRPGLFDDDDGLTKRALKGTPTPAALLARAWLLSNGCTIMPKSNGRRRGICKGAIEAYKKSSAALVTTQKDWLQFEGLWTEVQFINRLLEQFDEADSPGVFRSRLNSLCDQGAKIVASSPVNDVELAVQCTVAAANSKQWDRYFNMVQLHLETGLKDGELSNRSVSSAFIAADARCTNLQATSRHRLANKLPIPFGAKSTAHAFCIVAGHAAVGCFEFGHDIWSEYDGRGDLDWVGLKRAIGQRLTMGAADTQRCVYTDEYQKTERMKSRVRLVVEVQPSPAEEYVDAAEPMEDVEPANQQPLDELEDMFNQPVRSPDRTKPVAEPTPRARQVTVPSGSGGADKGDDEWGEYE